MLMPLRLLAVLAGGLGLLLVLWGTVSEASPALGSRSISEALSAMAHERPGTAPSVRAPAVPEGEALAASVAADSFDTGHASFGVAFGDVVVAHRVMAVLAMPGTQVRLRVRPRQASGPFRLASPIDSSAFRALRGTAGSPPSWMLAVPGRPGLYPITVTDASSGAAVRLQLFVLTPWDHEGERLDGYRIGQYRKRALRGLPSYERPPGFIRVTEANKDVRVAPHFRLRQFLCKQTDDMPQYVLMRTRLLQALEHLLAAANAQGIAASTFHVMSGYRTPYYNRRIGNTTGYSRHLYGDAADIFVDRDGDHYMDDLNGDGRATVADARLLARIARRTVLGGSSSSQRPPFRGGLGVYGPASHRGPFVHVDLRGYRARW
jgi:hypothetical protein